MSTIASHSSSFPDGGALDLRLSDWIGQRAFAVIRTWRANMRQRCELLTLNDVELRELSLTAVDVNRETDRPFWEGVQLTGR